MKTGKTIQNTFTFTKTAALIALIMLVPINYFGRTYEEGKKVCWKDGVRAIYAILKYNFFVAAPLPATRLAVPLLFEK